MRGQVFGICLTFLPKGEEIVLCYPLPTEEKIDVMKSQFSLLFMFTCLIFEAPFKPLMGGDVPFVTDDTGTPGHNKWDIDLLIPQEPLLMKELQDSLLMPIMGLGKEHS